MTLPTDSKARKNMPLARGCLDYFPDALAAVAELSRAGNDKHNPGQPLHWSREKSSDHADCILRHLVERGTVDPEDGILHDVKVAWRALAMAQLAIEQSRTRKVAIPGGLMYATVAPGSVTPCDEHGVVLPSYRDLVDGLRKT